MADHEDYEPDADEIEAMRSSEMAFRADNDLLDDDAWNTYCEGVGLDWLASQGLDPVPPEPGQAVPPFPASASRGRMPLESRGPHKDLTPIEAPFYDALAETGLTFSVQPYIEAPGRRYRLDFLVLYDGRGVAVELDGHEYHSSREQRTKDNERDRWLLSRNITVVRFTGSEIHKDADGCVRQLLDVVRQSQARP